jgi:uncharacterized protein YdeI (YjbR/CyaY-like superfamily)
VRRKHTTARERPEVPQVYFAGRAELRAWLTQHHAEHGPIWLVYDKSRPGRARPLSYDDIVEEALCFGWIDTVAGRVDGARAKVYFSPRKAGSVWSALNKRRIVDLESRGLMTDAGRAKIIAAKGDGSWNALDALDVVEAGTLPDDLDSAMRTNASARANFDRFPPGVRRQILQWIVTAKRPETRAARIALSVAMAAKNQRASDPKLRKAYVASEASLHSKASFEK